MTQRSLERWGFLAAAFALGPIGCRGDRPKDLVELVVPDGSGKTLELAPRAAFAEYVEVPGATNELRVTLASYEVSCESYIAPGPSDNVVVVTLRMPPTEKPHAGSFGSTPPLAEDAGAPIVTRAHAAAVIRRGTRGYVLEPGGTLELMEVDLGRTGAVAGTLALEFAGDGAHPASSVKGKFRARICRSDLTPGSQ